jgi:hypothetical protein
MIKNFQIKRGDSWELPSVLLKDGNGDPLPSPVVSARMMLRPSAGARTTAMEFSTADESILITDATMGWIEIPEKIMDFRAGIYAYDLEFTFADGRVLTPLSGKFTLTQDSSRSS